MTDSLETQLGSAPLDKAVSTSSQIIMRQKGTWENWGRTARCQPAYSFYPQHVEDLIQIVNFARERNLKIRVAASGHSWSSLIPTDGILVYIHALHKVTMDLSDEM